MGGGYDEICDVTFPLVLNVNAPLFFMYSTIEIGLCA